jgi:hypothetical protein
VKAVAQLPGYLVFSPDNLDGQFISPKAFRTHLADSYRLTTETLGQQGKRLVVHIGGPVGHLLPSLVQSGVDGFEGIAGAPQSDLSLAEARALCGPQPTLWGGIPQDYLLDTHEDQEFRAAVTQAVQQARGDARTILGIADRVPVRAETSRLEALPTLVGQAQTG